MTDDQDDEVARIKRSANDDAFCPQLDLDKMLISMVTVELLAQGI